MIYCGSKNMKNVCLFYFLNKINFFLVDWVMKSVFTVSLEALNIITRMLFLRLLMKIAFLVYYIKHILEIGENFFYKIHPIIIFSYLYIFSAYPVNFENNRPIIIRESEYIISQYFLNLPVILVIVNTTGYFKYYKQYITFTVTCCEIINNLHFQFTYLGEMVCSDFSQILIYNYSLIVIKLSSWSFT